MTIEEYLKRRNNGQSLDEIQSENYLSEGTIWTLELGYQCYLKKIPLDKAVNLIQSLPMKVFKGEEIKEIESGRTLIVERDFDSEIDLAPSALFDFNATYTDSSNIGADGLKIYTSRGLKVVDEGVIWKRV